MLKLRQITGQLRLVESLLDLVVDELDERVVLLGQLLLQNPVVFFSNFVGAFLAHLFADESHLLESKDRSVFVASFDGRGQLRPRHRRVWRCRHRPAVCIRTTARLQVGHHWLRRSRWTAPRIWLWWCDLTTLPQTLQLVPEVVGYLSGRQAGFAEHWRTRTWRRHWRAGNVSIDVFERRTSSSFGGRSIGRMQSLQRIKVQRTFECNTGHLFRVVWNGFWSF